MSKRSEVSFSKTIEFLDQWKKLGGLLAGIIYTVFSLFIFSSDFVFISEKLVFSIVMTLVGIILATILLVQIIRQRVENFEIVLPTNVKYNQRYFYSFQARLLALLGLFALAVATVFWVWVGVLPHLQKNRYSENAIQLPSGESMALAVSVDARFWGEPAVGFLEGGSLDNTVITPTLKSPNIVFPGHFSPRLTTPNFPSFMRVIITGKSSEEPVLVYTEIPIKVLSHKPVQDITDLAVFPAGGGGDYNFWLFEANVSAQSPFNVGQIVKARYSPDLKERLIELGDNAFYDPFPNEIQRAIEDGVTPPPDSFLLRKNTSEVVSIAAFFKDPGIYQIQVGIEYSFGGKHDTIFANPPIEILVLRDYNYWSPLIFSNLDDTYRLVRRCVLQQVDGDSEYQCEEIH